MVAQQHSYELSDEARAAIREKVAGEELAAKLMEFLEEEADGLPSDRSLKRFWECIRDAAAHRAPPAPIIEPAVPGVVMTSLAVFLPKDVDDALEACERIQSKANRVPERGEAFAESVRNSAIDVMTTIGATNCVTYRQTEAIANWEAALDKWLRDEDD